MGINDNFLIGVTLYPQFINVLKRFLSHKVTLTADVSLTYRAFLLPEEQQDLHQFVWRKDLLQPLKEYRMTRLTFGVCTYVVICC